MLKRRWNGFLAGLTVLGGVVSLLTLYPRMTITTDFDTTDPSKSSFLISNDGYLPVYSVRVHCLLNTLNIQNSPQISSRLPNGEKGESGRLSIPENYRSLRFSPALKRRYRGQFVLRLGSHRTQPCKKRAWDCASCINRFCGRGAALCLKSSTLEG
jgi:hypothetical protein